MPPHGCPCFRLLSPDFPAALPARDLFYFLSIQVGIPPAVFQPPASTLPLLQTFLSCQGPNSPFSVSSSVRFTFPVVVAPSYPPCWRADSRLCRQASILLICVASMANNGSRTSSKNQWARTFLLHSWVYPSKLWGWSVFQHWLFVYLKQLKDLLCHLAFACSTSLSLQGSSRVAQLLNSLISYQRALESIHNWG